MAAQARGQSRDVETVFHGDGNAVEQAGLESLIGSTGGFAGLIGEEHGKGVEMGIAALDLVEMSVDQFEGFDTSRTDQGYHLNQRQAMEHKLQV